AISGTGSKQLGRVLANAGTLDYTGSNLLFFGGVVNNSGVFDAVGGGGFTFGTAGANVFNNAGTFHRSGPGSTTTFSNVAFNNSGTVHVAEGTLQLDSSTSSGAFVVSGGATLSLAGIGVSTYALNAGASESGDGTLLLSTGTLTVNADVNAQN